DPARRPRPRARGRAAGRPLLAVVRAREVVRRRPRLAGVRRGRAPRAALPRLLHRRRVRRLVLRRRRRSGAPLVTPGRPRLADAPAEPAPLRAGARATARPDAGRIRAPSPEPPAPRARRRLPPGER